MTTDTLAFKYDLSSAIVCQGHGTRGRSLCSLSPIDPAPRTCRCIRSAASRYRVFAIVVLRTLCEHSVSRQRLPPTTGTPTAFSVFDFVDGGVFHYVFHRRDDIVSDVKRDATREHRKHLGRTETEFRSVASEQTRRKLGPRVLLAPGTLLLCDSFDRRKTVPEKNSK